MGNTAGKVKEVDHGQTKPFGKLYPNPPDYNQEILTDLIVNRRLSPFYIGQETGKLELSNSSKSTSHRKMKKSNSCATLETCPITTAELYAELLECPICFLVINFNLVLSQKYQLYEML